MKTLFGFLFCGLVLLSAGRAPGQMKTTGATNKGTFGARPTPAKLVMDVSFTSHSRDQMLYRDEMGETHVSVANIGGTEARSVVIRTHLSGSVQGVQIDTTARVGSIRPGDTVNVKFDVLVGDVTEKQTLFVPVSVSDESGATIVETFSVVIESRNRERVGDVPPGSSLRHSILKGKQWLLIIGVNRYAHWPHLRNAVTDAQAFRDLCTEQYQFSRSNLIELYNEEATRANIIRKLEYLVRNVRPEDNLLIYYAGHGSFEEQLNRGFWVPTDAEMGSTAMYLPNSDLQTFISAIPSRSTLVMSDACFSGTVFRDDQGGATAGQGDRYFREVSRLKARQAITSGGNEPVVDSGVSSRHSIFSYYVLDKLMNNREKYLTAMSLFERIKIGISNSSLQTPQCRPIHNTGHEGGEFVFVRKD